MVFSIWQSVGEFRGHSPWWVINPKVDVPFIHASLSLLAFGRCSPLTLNEWHAWFSSRYRGDLMEIGMWTPQKLQAWDACVDWLSSTHDAFQATKNAHMRRFFPSRWRLTPCFSVENPW
ncbi:hypothetical protein AAG906_012800 [Vitis piasezkii]